MCPECSSHLFDLLTPHLFSLWVLNKQKKRFSFNSFLLVTSLPLNVFLYKNFAKILRDCIPRNSEIELSRFFTLSGDLKVRLGPLNYFTITHSRQINIFLLPSLFYKLLLSNMIFFRALVIIFSL